MINRCSSYKDSSVEWKENLDGFWESKPLKYVVDYNKKLLAENTAPDYELKYIEISDVNNIGEILNTTTYLFKDAPSRCRRILSKDDVFISTVRTYLKAIGYIKEECEDFVCSTGFCVLSPKESLNPGYLYYSIINEKFLNEVISKSTGVSYPAITPTQLINIKINIPPLTEQTQIVEFLDSKTSLIDKLISVKQRKIELLKEKRTALINHVVTKGLDPYVKIKESGVEWIGKIPENWGYKKITHCFDLIGSGTTPASTNSEYYEEGEINWLQTGDLTDGMITRTSKLITQKAFDDLNLKIYPSNSLIIAMYGATIGKVGLLKIETTTNQACCVLAEPKGVFVNYVFYWFIANKDKIVSLGYGGGQPNISQETIKSLRIHCPPTEEQTQIVEYLDEKTKEIDNVLTLEQKKIDLLKEYRQSLISEVVTGKIKVTKD